MRLIDADKIHPDCMTKDGKLAISQSQLANATTVPLSDFKEGYKQAIIDGKTNFSRPQGEWIEENSETGAIGIKYTWVRCNQCGWNNSLVIPKNFCPNCGADMRGENTDS